MTIRTRLYILVTILVVGSALVMYLSSRQVLQGGFAELEQQSVEADVHRALAAVDEQVSDLQLLTSDNGTWNEPYDYVNGRNPSFLTRNFPPTYLHRIRLYTLVVCDRHGRILDSVTSPDSKGHLRQTPRELLRAIQSMGMFSLAQTRPLAQKCVTSLGKQVLIVVSVPILHSNGCGPASGRLVFVREADNRAVSTLNSITTLEVALIPLHTAIATRELSGVYSELMHGKPSVIRLPDRYTAQGYALLKDCTGRPAVLVRVETNRKALVQAEGSAAYLLIVTVAFACLFAILAISMWRRTVFGRLTILVQELKAIGLGTATDVRLSERGGDEIAAVAMVLNSTLDRLHESRNEVINEREKLSVTLSSIADAVIATDADMHITYANDAALAILGMPNEALVGRSIDEVMVLEDEETGNSLPNPVCWAVAARSEVQLPGGAVLVRQDGVRIPIDDSASPIITSNGELVGSVIVFRDVTETRKAMEVLEVTQYATDKACDMVIWVDSDGRLHYVNESACHSLGYSREELLGMRVWDVGPDVTEENWLDHWNALIDAGNAITPSRHRTKDGRVIPVEICSSYHEFGEARYLFTYVRDITGRVESEAQMRLQVSAINATKDQIAILDPNGRVEFVNNAFEDQTGHARENILGSSLNILSPGQPKDEAFDKMWESVTGGNPWTGETMNVCRNGQTCYCEVTITPVFDEFGKTEHFVAVRRDISDRKSHEERLDRQARQDTLTRLPNRLVFNETLSSMVVGKRRSEAMLGVMFIDLDKFKSVNDTLGHDAGDKLLVEAGKRLRKCLRDTDVLCRMGGDEFTIILRQLSAPQDAKIVADRILAEMHVPFIIKGNEFHIGASIGVSIYPRDARDFAGIVKSADMAMYRAKELGRNNCQFYHAEMGAENIERMQIEKDLRQALNKGELHVYYQPRVDPISGKLLEAESLVRWHHPTRGVVSASEFIPVAEETGLIMDMGDCVLEAVCVQQRKWLDAGMEPIPIAINLSAKQALRTEFLSTIRMRIEKYDLPVSLFSLDLPGKSLPHLSEQTLQVIQDLRELGMRFTVDDFGSGNMPMTMLSKVPLDCLKLESAQMTSATSSGGDIRVVASIVGMARNLGLQVIAAGVETPYHLELAGSMMCDIVQGYLISKPLPVDEFERFAARDNCLAHITSEAA